MRVLMIIRRVIFIGILGICLYACALFVEYGYMSTKYEQVAGNIDSVRNSLWAFSEWESTLSDLGQGYIDEAIYQEQNWREFRVFKYRTFLGGYFHVIFDDQGTVWGRAPTGFTDFF